MSTPIASLDRRRFLRGSGVALALPWFEFSARPAAAAETPAAPKRLACFYFPDGVPMPLAEDPSHKDWSWFPHGSGQDYTFTKCLDPLEPLRDELTVLAGFSHPSVRSIHGHSNADQFLTGAATGPTGDYKNSISLDQEFAAHVGDQTRFASLVLSTDGGTGTPRGAHTASFNRSGRAIPEEHRPKRIFDMLFVKSDGDAARRLALSQSALDDLLVDARSLRKALSTRDQKTLDEYLQSVRDTEVKVEKAKRWINIPLPKVDVNHLNLDVTPEDPRNYLQTMYDLIYLAFRTDSTRVATYQITNMADASSKAGKFPQLQGWKDSLHTLAHAWNKPEGAAKLGKWDRFMVEQFSYFLSRLAAAPEENGSILDNSVILYGSSNSETHNNNNYPLLLAGGRQLGLHHGRFLKFGSEVPMSNLLMTMLDCVDAPCRQFADSTGRLDALTTA